MKIIETTADIEKIRPGCVLTIGNFDGVHIGHQEILAVAKRIAAQRKAELTVATFEPHPVAILHPERAPRVLTPLKLKSHLLAKYGVDCLIVLKDSAELLNLSPADFVERFLAGTIKPAVVVEGESFNFGSGRTGTVHTLYNLGRQKGFEVVIIETKEVKLSIGQSVKVSSTMIRNLLESGKAADADIALTRPYRLIGQVVRGRGKGKQLGFPTANLAPARQIIPAEGVYAGFTGIGNTEEQVCSSEEKIPAAFSIGLSSTYSSDNHLLIEAHLLINNVGDLSSNWMAMDFIERMREQIKFETESQLAEQIAKDCEIAKSILATEKRI